MSNRRQDWLLLILLLGFAIRFSLSWHPGYGFDTGVYMGWARSAVQLGLAHSYIEQVGGNMLPNYPPFSIMIFAAAGQLYQMFINPVLDVYAKSFLMFIKLPGILTDVLLAAILYGIVKRWKSRKAGLLAAAVYAFHPVTIFDSAVWGQTDCMYTFFLVLAVAAWSFDHRHIAAATLALAALTKVQAISLFPLFAFLLWREPKKLLVFSLVGIFTTLLVLVPFIAGNTLEPALKVYFSVVGQYNNISIGAYNLWWALLSDRAWQLKDTDLLFNFIQYKQAGILLCGLAYAGILAIFRDAIRRPGNPEAFFYCAAMLAFAFFLFLPEMHERYLFPFVGLGVPLVFINRRTAWYYGIATIAFWINLMGILQFTPIDVAMYKEFESLDTFIAVTQVWMFTLLIAEAWRRYAPRPFIPKLSSLIASIARAHPR